MSLRTLFVLAVLAVVLLPFVVFDVVHRRHERKHCTHGASSLGPVVITNGHVSGSTVPQTEACLP